MWPGGDAAGLWLAVVGVGVWHGLNPAMGWPLAVANGLSTRRGTAVAAALLPLGGGHLLAMAVLLLPFALLGAYLDWGPPVRLGAGALVLLFGVYRLVQRRHPRQLARVRPTQLALWAFLMANVHGAGLMLLPFAVGLCTSPGAASGASAATALLVAGVHTAAMLAAGGGIAWVVYRHVGLGVLTRGWLNADALWGASLVLAGAAGLATA